MVIVKVCPLLRTGLARPVPSVAVQSYYRLGDTLALGLIGSGMVPLRSDSIRIDEREVARFGRLIVTLGISLQAALR